MGILIKVKKKEVCLTCRHGQNNKITDKGQLQEFFYGKITGRKGYRAQLEEFRGVGQGLDSREKVGNRQL